MELQWPLILFTTFVAWSAGLFGAQGAAALAGEGKRAQLPALVCSAALLAVGGIAVFFHLEHFERIFNGFGNPTSGITQELVCVVVVAALMVAMFAMLRKADGDADAPACPKWLAVLAIVAAAVLVLVTGHSYMMVARPAWDSLLGPLSLLGAAAAMGPLTFAVVEAVRGEAVGKCVALAALAGSVANAVLAAAYLFAMEAAGDSYTDVGYYFDPIHPTAGMADVAALSPMAGESVAMVAVAVIAALVPIIAAVLGRKSGNWKLWGAVGAACAVVGAVALRMAFYSVGASVYLFY
ncbi:MAG: DmsC/YnfH family molybdoenzyme membrane anchor subunit [Adlercreutzia equolifaciens]